MAGERSGLVTAGLATPAPGTIGGADAVGLAGAVTRGVPVAGGGEIAALPSGEATPRGGFDTGAEVAAATAAVGPAVRGAAILAGVGPAVGDDSTIGSKPFCSPTSRNPRPARNGTRTAINTRPSRWPKRDGTVGGWR